jgi:hypothetical protein
MSQFWVPDQESANRCNESRYNGTLIVVSGVDAMERKVRLYTGLVQSVEDNGTAAVSGRRWRVTMHDSN